jgi:ABC-2 type transport system ATP-binding protein
METNALEIVGLSKSYANFRLASVDLALPAGVVVGLVGQNGMGKSTLIKSALGLVRKDAGRILLPCVADADAVDNIRAYVGYVPETLTFYEWMKVRRMIRFVSAYYPHWDEQYAEELLVRYNLDPDKQIKHLSKGMRAKLALLLALAHRPPLLILDEPTSGLDPIMKHDFLQELRRIITTGAAQAVLISSHILGEVEQVADRVAVLRDGRLALYAETAAVLAEWKKVVFFAPQRNMLILPSEWPVHLLGDGRSMVMVKQDEAPRVIELLRGQGAQAVGVVNPDLQEVFLQVA